VIYNPIKVPDFPATRQRIEAQMARAGWAEPIWLGTTVDDPGASMCATAVEEAVDVVIVCGGDGTVMACVTALAGGETPLALLPAGTGNLLARNLGIPLDDEQAAIRIALTGADRHIDVAAVEHRKFAVMAGLGFDAAIMEGVNENIKAKVGWLAYVWSALKSLMFPAIRVEVSVDGAPFTRHRARTLVIGNVGFLQAGMPLIPDAAIDDGKLDVVLLYPRRFLSWVPLAVRVLTRNKRTDETITRMTGREVVVRTSVDAPRQLDGDLIPPGRELRATCVHGRLLVRVPR